MTSAAPDLVGQDSGYRKHKVVDNYIHSVVKTEEEMKSLWLENRLTTACQDGDTLIYDEFNRSRPEANNPFLSILSERILNLPKLRRSSGGYLRVHPLVPRHFHLQSGGIRRRPQNPGRLDGPADHHPTRTLRPPDRGRDHRRPLRRGPGRRRNHR